MSEGYPWIPRQTNSNDSTVCMANFKILPATVKKIIKFSQKKRNAEDKIVICLTHLLSLGE